MPSRAATVEALLSGQIDVGLLETTDARLAVAPVMLLVDDRGLQPPENVVPLVRSGRLDRWGEELRTALDEVSARLTTNDLVQLNRAVETRRADPGGGRRAGGGADWPAAPRGLRCSGTSSDDRAGPVIARPTISVFTSRVPS